MKADDVCRRVALAVARNESERNLIGLVHLSRRLLVAGSICWIVCGLDLREPLQAGGVDLGDPVLEPGALDVVFDIAIPQSAFKDDELSLREGLGELREIAPGVDAVPFGAGLVVALVILSVLLGCEIEDGVLTVVLGCLCLCMLSEEANETDFVEHGVWLRFFLVCPLP